MSVRARHARGAAAARTCALLLALAAVAPGPGARAERVTIGRYVELSVGRAAGHPYATTAGDGRRTGQSPFRAPTQAPVRQWRLQLSERALSPPAVRADGVLLLGSRSGVHAVDPTGKLAWTAAVGAVRFTPALTAEGEALIVAGGALQLLSPDGEARPLSLSAPARGLPLLLESSVVVVGAADGQAHVLGLDGGYLASVPLPERGPRFSTALGHGLLAIAGHGPALTLLSAHGGQERLVRLPGAPITAPIATPEGTLLALTDGGAVLEIDAAGAVRSWLELGPSVLAAGPALGRDGGLRVGLRHGELACLGPGGVERWRRGIDGQPSAITLAADDTALLVSSRGTLYAIAPDGELRFRARTELLGGSRPVLGGDGLLYLVGRGGVVEAWR